MATTSATSRRCVSSIARGAMRFSARSRCLCRALPVRGAAAGMHILVWLPAGTDDVAISDRAAGNGIRVGPLSPMYLTSPARSGLLLGYGRLPEEDIAPAVRSLARVLAAAPAL